MGWAAKPRAAAVAAGCLIQPRLVPAWPACGRVSLEAHLTRALQVDVVQGDLRLHWDGLPALRAQKAVRLQLALLDLGSAIQAFLLVEQLFERPLVLSD